jgi:hypothetical protein
MLILHILVCTDAKSSFDMIFWGMIAAAKYFVLQVTSMKENLYKEILAKLNCIEQIIKAQNVTMKSGLYTHVADLKELVKVEWKKYNVSSNATCFYTLLLNCTIGFLHVILELIFLIFSVS